MKTITFECEVITPMFLAGADGKTPELRPPSIKGAMRFWWRAVNGHLSLSQLKAKETEIFGGGGTKAKRSSFDIVVNYDKEPIIIEERLVLHKTFKLPAIKPGFQFKITLQSKDEEKLQTAAYIFILLSFLGGLGKRSRRGMGSFRILKMNEEVFSKVEIIDFLNEIKRGLKEEVQNIENHQNIPFIKKNQIGKKDKDYFNLLKNIGNASHDFDDNSLGLAKDGYRFSSPVYVSIIQLEEKNYQIVITELNIPFLKGNKLKLKNSKKQIREFSLDFEKQKKFIEALK